MPNAWPKQLAASQLPASLTLATSQRLEWVHTGPSWPGTQLLIWLATHQHFQPAIKNGFVASRLQGKPGASIIMAIWSSANIQFQQSAKAAVPPC
jgi:hypothetical protein